MEFFYEWLENIRYWWSGLFSPKRPLAAGGESRLYVGNLSYGAKEDELKQLFGRFGRVSEITIIKDRMTKKPKGYAFVEMSAADASKALALNGTDFLGRKIVVSEAREKEGGARREKRNHWRRKRSNYRYS